MSVHKYTSWGRTRRPKNIAGDDGTAITLESAPTTDATAGYRTENQRYLHISTIGTGDVDNVWVYYYATGKWSELLFWDLSNNVKRSVTVAPEEAIIIDIQGADLVAFKLGNASTVYAACSTF